MVGWTPTSLISGAAGYGVDEGQKDGIRYGLERADTDQVVVSRGQRHKLFVMQLLDEQRRQEIFSLLHKVEKLTRANEKLVRQLRETKTAGVPPRLPCLMVRHTQRPRRDIKRCQ